MMIESCKRAVNVMKGLLLAGLFVACSSALAEPQPAQNTDKNFSEANRLLFMTDHLHDIPTPSTLEYDYEHRGHDGESYEDSVVLDIEEGDDAGKRIGVDFLSGDRHRYVPDIGNAHGNPVIMMFLQNDVSTLAQRTGGSWRYFQRRVKFALEDAATVTRETARFDGKKVPVERIQLAPYAKEQAHREKLAGATQRRYTFLLSEAVPGGVLEISAQTPDGQGKMVSLDRLTLNPSAAKNSSVQGATASPTGSAP